MISNSELYDSYQYLLRSLNKLSAELKAPLPRKISGRMPIHKTTGLIMTSASAPEQKWTMSTEEKQTLEIKNLGAYGVPMVIHLVVIDGMKLFKMSICLRPSGLDPWCFQHMKDKPGRWMRCASITHHCWRMSLKQFLHHAFWVYKLCIILPCSTSQTLILLSSDPDITYFLYCENTTDESSGCVW